MTKVTAKECKKMRLNKRKESDTRCSVYKFIKLIQSCNGLVSLEGRTLLSGYSFPVAIAILTLRDSQL